MTWTIDLVKETLDVTIVKDNAAKLIAFFAMLLNYTENDQLNIAFIAESSTGKTHIAMEVAKFFPDEDIITLAYVTPQSFFYEHGTLIDQHGKLLKPKHKILDCRMKEWEKQNPKPTKHGTKTAWNNERKETRKRIKNEIEKIDVARFMRARDAVLANPDYMGELFEKDVLQMVSPPRDLFQQREDADWAFANTHYGNCPTCNREYRVSWRLQRLIWEREENLNG